MTQQTINIGSVANDGTGDPLRTAFDKTNDNFDELYVFDEGAKVLHGFPLPYEATLSYSAVNRQITLTPISSTFDIWLSGVRHTKTGAQTSSAHADATGNYFVTYDANGDLQVSDTVWDILGAGIPVAYIYYNATLTDGICLFELHTAGRNLSWHKSQHSAIGTFVKSGLEITGYTLATDTDAAVTYAVASGVVVDEDIEVTVTALADNGPYTILRRSGATDWTWDSTSVVPYLYTPAGYIQYNQNNGGSYQMTQLAANNYTNYWVFATTSITANKQLVVVPSQAVYTTLSDAQAESVASIAWGGILIPEIVGVWKITYETKSNNSSTGKVQIVAVSRISLTRSQISGNFTAGTHNALTGRDALDSHPISAITGGVSGPVSSTDNALVRFDGVGGKTLQGSVATLSDNGNLTVPDPSNATTYDAGYVFANGGANNVGFRRYASNVIHFFVDTTPYYAFESSLGFRVHVNAALGWGSSTVLSADLELRRDAANTLAQRRTTNAQTYRLYNTYTDASNYERLAFTWSTNVAEIKTEAAGTGTLRDLSIGSTGGKLAFLGATPVVRQAHVADADTAHALNATFSDTEVEAALNTLGTKINSILATLEAFGLHATS
jgi:hypothetical protein